MQLLNGLSWKSFNDSRILIYLKLLPGFGIANANLSLFSILSIVASSGKKQHKFRLPIVRFIQHYLPKFATVTCINFVHTRVVSVWCHVNCLAAFFRCCSPLDISYF